MVAAPFEDVAAEEEAAIIVVGTSTTQGLGADFEGQATGAGTSGSRLAACGVGVLRTQSSPPHHSSSI